MTRIPRKFSQQRLKRRAIPWSMVKKTIDVFPRSECNLKFFRPKYFFTLTMQCVCVSSPPFLLCPSEVNFPRLDQRRSDRPTDPIFAESFVASFDDVVRFYCPWWSGWTRSRLTSDSSLFDFYVPDFFCETSSVIGKSLLLFSHGNGFIYLTRSFFFGWEKTNLVSYFLWGRRNYCERSRKKKSVD